MDLLSAVVPLLISMLNEPGNVTSANNNSNKLHDTSLQKLIDIATQFRGDFQAVMQKFPALKSRLEFALQSKNSRASSDIRGFSDGMSEAARASQQQQFAQPTIKLKMDFSNFAAPK